MQSPSGVVEMRKAVKHGLYTRVAKPAYFQSKHMNQEIRDCHRAIII